MKIIHKYLSFLFFIVVLISCTKEEVEKLELQVKLKGTVILYNQFGELNNDYSNVVITITDTYNDYIPEIDTDGNYEILDLTTGTYNIFVTAHGYETIKFEGVQFLGGELWQVKNFDLVQPSTAKISDFEIINENGALYAKGKITNEQTPNSDYFNNSIIIFINDSSDVSPVNYNIAFGFYVETNDDNEFKTRFYYSMPEKCYCIACSRSYASSYYEGIGTPSNVAVYILN